MTKNDESDDHEFIRRIILFQEGQLSEADIVDFEHTLRTDEGKRAVYVDVEMRSAEIARLLKRDAMLIDELSPQHVASLKQQTPVFALSRSWIGIAGGSICMLAGLIWLCCLPNNQLSDLNSLGAIITHADNASWAIDDASSPIDGVRLKTQTDYHLTGGSIRMRLASGGIVSIEAPTAFQILAQQRLNLIHGRLAAWSRHPSSRVTIQVDNHVIRDLGTAFGVHASAEKDVDLAVFKGSVELTVDDVPSKSILKEGQSAKIFRNSPSAQPIAFDTSPYTKLWPLAAGIDHVSHLIDFVPPGPNLNLESLANDDKLFLIPERLYQRLASPMAVDLTGGNAMGKAVSWPRPQRDVDIPVLPSGRVLSSYLLMYRPTTQRVSTYRSLSGSIEFEKPIAALCVQGKRLELSERVFGLPGISYQSMTGRTLEDRPFGVAKAPSDSLRISSDGRRLDFELHVNIRSDHIRVLVDETSTTEKLP